MTKRPRTHERAEVQRAVEECLERMAVEQTVGGEEDKLGYCCVLCEPWCAMHIPRAPSLLISWEPYLIDKPNALSMMALIIRARRRIGVRYTCAAKKGSPARGAARSISAWSGGRRRAANLSHGLRSHVVPAQARGAGLGGQWGGSDRSARRSARSRGSLRGTRSDLAEMSFSG